MAGLYIDHGWDMGWCLKTRSGVTSGVEHLKKGNAMEGFRLLAGTQFFTRKLTELAAIGETLDEIAYELIDFVGENDAATVHAHGAQRGNLLRWAALKGQPEPRGIPWDVIKKHVTGHRSAARETMLAVVKASMPEVANHNQASAVAVMLTATNQKLPQPEASPRAKSSPVGANRR
jgi:Holliday junction resolvasome RuvABC endonuclease subunit